MHYLWNLITGQTTTISPRPDCKMGVGLLGNMLCFTCGILHWDIPNLHELTHPYPIYRNRQPRFRRKLEVHPGMFCFLGLLIKSRKSKGAPLMPPFPGDDWWFLIPWDPHFFGGTALIWVIFRACLTLFLRVEKPMVFFGKGVHLHRFPYVFPQSPRNFPLFFLAKILTIFSHSSMTSRHHLRRLSDSDVVQESPFMQRRWQSQVFLGSWGTPGAASGKKEGRFYVVLEKRSIQTSTQKCHCLPHIRLYIYIHVYIDLLMEAIW